MCTSNSSPDLTTIARQLESQGPAAILRWALATYGCSLTVATGFGPEGIVILHLVSQIDSRVKVFYLETDLFFEETYTLRDQLQTRLGLTFERVHSGLSLEQQAASYGENLWQNDPDLCCYLRKVIPLRQHLAGKLAWVTGIRRGQTPARANAQVVEWDQTNGLSKINPLVFWSAEQVQEYTRIHNLPSNPLRQRGYPSIGCWPCTRAVQPGENPRIGRWPGFPKTECGLHLSVRSSEQNPKDAQTLADESEQISRGMK